MNRARLAWLLAVGVLALCRAQSAHAQYNPYTRPQYGPYSRPYTISPYLGLVGGNNPAINYFLRVLPEFDRRQTERQFGQAIIDLERRRQTPAEETSELFPTLPGTGHPVGFNTFYPYYNMGGGIGRPLPTARNAPPLPTGRFGR